MTVMDSAAMTRLCLCALIAAALAGCTRFPAPDAANRRADPARAFPAIQPLDDLLAQAAGGDSTPGAALAARAAALGTRAAALRAAP